MRTINPLDARYGDKLKTLSAYASAQTLIENRVKVECKYFCALSKIAKLFKITKQEEDIIAKIQDISDNDVSIIDAIEKKGYKNIKATNHDVKAIEYFIKDKFEKTSLKNRIEWIHFALTSEDINSIAYALIIRDSVEQVIIPSLIKIKKEFEKFANRYAKLPMLSRTHGQCAVPTTLGKEFKVFEYRLARQISQLKQIRVSCKFAGAVGNYNAHYYACEDINWIKFSRQFVSSFNEKNKIKVFLSEITTQIDSHDTYSEVFDIMKRANNILIDFSADVWRYISDGWIKQKVIAGEVGSSAMPQKVNPIDFENAEGNLGLANTLLEFFVRKLTVSRLQRDLSDSTVERNFACAFGYCEVAYQAILKGLGKIDADKNKISDVLNNNPEVLAEAIQTLLRVYGVETPYEKLKSLTRGKKVTLKGIYEFVDSLDISLKVKSKLKQLKPNTYIGVADKLAKQKIKISKR